MFKSRKINILEDRYGLLIDFKWFKWTAIPMAIFTLVWCGFLAVWYGIILTQGGPWIAIAFPILHVLVGLFLAYSTLCNFLNKTEIKLDQNNLSITHSPIPWWRGDTHLNTDDIAQFYVKEKVSRGKNGTTRNYQLRAKTKARKDISVLRLSDMDSNDMLLIEEKLEQYLGISDEAVKGEYGKISTGRIAHGAPTKRNNQQINSPFDYQYFSIKGEYIHLKRTEYEIVSVLQSDWNDGNSDKQFQLIDEYGKEQLLFIQQNKALLASYEERPLSLMEAEQFSFDKANHPHYLQVDGTTYFLDSFKVGVVHVPGIYLPIESKQWIYKTADKKKYIRVIDKDNVPKYFLGRSLVAEDFEVDSSLDLNKPPTNAPWIKRYDEDDFV